MVSSAMPGSHVPDPTGEPRLNVEPDRLHLVLGPTELDIVVDALRSVGNIELAEHFDAVLRQFSQRPSR